MGMNTKTLTQNNTRHRCALGGVLVRWDKPWFTRSVLFPSESQFSFLFDLYDVLMFLLLFSFNLITYGRNVCREQGIRSSDVLPYTVRLPGRKGFLSPLQVVSIYIYMYSININISIHHSIIINSITIISK